MKWILILTLFLRPFLYVTAQNLILNPGFEAFSSCPDDYAQIPRATPWLKGGDEFPDFYHTCAEVTGLQVPNAGIFDDSYQQPRSGKGYAGIWVYANDGVQVYTYLQGQLSRPLTKGKQYYLEFYVSPDRPASSPPFYTDAVGMALTDTLHFTPIKAGETLPLTPVIENRNSVIRDTAGWTKVSGCYKAQRQEEFVTIGNFRNQFETTVEIGITDAFTFQNYFYVDDVLVMLFDPLPDTVFLCSGDQLTFNAAFLDARYYWNTGSLDSAITVDGPGAYTVEATIDHCILRDTVLVLDSDVDTYFPADTSACSEQPLSLRAPLPGTYRWSDGSDRRQISIATPGRHAVTVTNECGEFSFSTEVAIQECECAIYVPNAFSPNGDGLNDFLTVQRSCNLAWQINRFGVYDRWGAEVYASSTGDEVKWNGTFKGRPVPVGVYVWFLEYQVEVNGTTQQRIERGSAAVLR